MQDQHVTSCFSRRLRQAREAKRLSQRVLAKRAGIPQDNLCMYETGRRSPRPSAIYRLPQALDVDANYFFAMTTTDDPQIDEMAALLSLLSSDVQRHLMQVIRRVSAAQEQQKFFNDHVRPLSEEQQALQAIEHELAAVEATGTFESVELLIRFSAVVLLSLELGRFGSPTDHLLKSLDVQSRRMVKAVFGALRSSE